MSRVGQRPIQAVLILLILASGCVSTSPPAAPTDPARRLESAARAYDAARRAAYAPRRFKALFKGEVSPTVGAVGRGYLSVWWNGSELAWRASAPLVGARGGVLRRDAASPGAAPIPGHLSGADAIAALLGVIDLPAPGRADLVRARDEVVLSFDDAGTTATVDRAGLVVRLTFPGETIVNLQPGQGVPRRIEAKSPEGRAVLTLESFSAWREGERVPPA